jgi:hypothetical protein
MTPVAQAIMPQMLPRHIVLPGEPRFLALPPADDHALVVWDAQRGATVSSHAALVDIRTARVHVLGPAMAAFWSRWPASWWMPTGPSRLRACGSRI